MLIVPEKKKKAITPAEIGSHMMCSSCSSSSFITKKMLSVPLRVRSCIDANSYQLS